MIRWITGSLGTAAYGKALREQGVRLVDVRDLVDKRGNPMELVKRKVLEVKGLLDTGEKVLVCCDYGVSRSNSIAAGALALTRDISFTEAVMEVSRKTGEREMKIEVLSSVRAAVENLRSLGKDNSPDGVSVASILLTGASGFAGSALLERLRNKYDVHAPSKEDIDLTCNVFELDALVSEKKVTRIIHLANPGNFGRHTAMGDVLVMCKNVLEVCRLNGAKMIFVSCSGVYSGTTGEFKVVGEENFARPGDSVGESKYLCEKLIENYYELYGLDYTVLRTATIYGGGEQKPKFIFNFMQKAASGEDIFIHKYENGYSVVDMLHLEDFCRAVMNVMQNDFSGTVNIGSGKAVDTHELARMLVEIAGSTSSVKFHELESRAPSFLMDISKAGRELGWKPRIEIKEGLREVFERTISKSGEK